MTDYGKTEKWKNYTYALLMFVFGMVGATAQNNHFHLMAVIQIRVRSCLSGLIYRKSLQVSPSASAGEWECGIFKRVSFLICLHETTILTFCFELGLTTGDLVNLLSVDVQQVAELFDPVENVNKVFNALILFGFPCYYLWRLLGPSAIASPAILLLSLPFNGFFVMQSRKSQGEQMKERDKRMGLLSEAVANIKVRQLLAFTAHFYILSLTTGVCYEQILKLYAWELPWELRIQGHRSEEVLYLTRAAYWTAGFIVLLTSTPYIVSSIFRAGDAETNVWGFIIKHSDSRYPS